MQQTKKKFFLNYVFYVRTVKTLTFFRRTSLLRADVRIKPFLIFLLFSWQKERKNKKRAFSKRCKDDIRISKFNVREKKTKERIEDKFIRGEW